MTDHPITPPTELVKKIFGDALRGNSGQHDYELRLIHAAYAAGADRELEACCEWLDTEKILTKDGGYIRKLRAARRPKPPSLKEQALEDFNGLMSELDGAGNYSNCAERIRRALEQLDD